MRERDKQELRILYSSPEYVYDWLEHNKPRVGAGTHALDYLTETEATLLKRSDDLINLGLALYGHCAETGQALFKTGNEDLKRAVLSGSTVRQAFQGSWDNEGSWVEMDGHLATFLSDFDDNDDNRSSLYTLVANEYLPDPLLIDLFKKEGLFESLSDKNWHSVLRNSAGNRRLSVRYDGELYGNAMDGYADVTAGSADDEVFVSVWQLFEELPVNNENASVLNYLAENLACESIVLHSKMGKDAYRILEKWTKSKAEKNQLSDTALQKLASFVPIDSEGFKRQRDHDNPILRYFYYTRFEPKNVKEVEALEKKDSSSFHFAARENPLLFEDRAIRKMLAKRGIHGPAADVD